MSDSSARLVWVLAPHPDDEVLMAADRIARRVREGAPTRVVVMTNGDFTCARDGWRRQRETVEAMAVLGLSEESIVFLGYPDGYLAELGPEPLPPIPRMLQDGTCGLGETTFGVRGRDQMEFHRARTGHSARLTSANLLEDLVSLLEADRPSDIYLPQPYDDHPDHAMTYVFLRRALERAHLSSLPDLHRAYVHAGPCWPNGARAEGPCGELDSTLGTAFPPLPAELGRYAPDERIPTLERGALALRAIARYRSQLESDVEHDWLGQFARGESIYWHESLTRSSSIEVSRTTGRRALDSADDQTHLATRSGEPTTSRGSFECRAELGAGHPTEFELSIHTNSESDYLVRLASRQLILTDPSGRNLVSRPVPAGTAAHRVSIRADALHFPELFEWTVRIDGELFAFAIDAGPLPEGLRCEIRTSLRHANAN